MLTRVGITCALCHSTVDDSFAPGIGKRLDGWPNRDLNPGAILALSPAFDAATKAQLNAWGPGKYDPRFNIDGLSKPVVIPPAYGLAGVHRVTFTGDGNDLAYWNRYVAVTQMGGLGSFIEPRLNLSITNGSVDLVTSKLPALQAYQLSIAAPAAPAGSFDPAAAARGQQVFAGAGGCATCHSGALFTDANSMLHPPADSMAEPETPSYASRSATKRYRTSPLKGVWQHPPYFHDGSAATLEDVVRDLQHAPVARPQRPAVGRPGPVPEVALTPTRRRYRRPDSRDTESVSSIGRGFVRADACRDSCLPVRHRTRIVSFGSPARYRASGGGMSEALRARTPSCCAACCARRTGWTPPRTRTGPSGGWRA